MQRTTDEYPARLDIEYPQSLGRVSTLLRPILAIPTMVLLSLMSPALLAPLLLMLLVRQKYPRWWFDFNLELTRFQARITAFLNLMTDQYPSTDEEQMVKARSGLPRRDAAQSLAAVREVAIGHAALHRDQLPERPLNHRGVRRLVRDHYHGAVPATTVHFRPQRRSLEPASPGLRVPADH